MEFVIAFHPDANGPLSAPDRQRAGAAVLEYVQHLERDGILRGGLRLDPDSEPVLIRVGNGVVSSTPASGGPLGPPSAIVIIEAETTEAAHDIAAACPIAAIGAVELRPVLRRIGLAQ